MKIINKLHLPEDIKKLNLNELEDLASDTSKLILERSSKIGGHLASNLGIIEITLALHYVFDFPKDKVIFDVSHQCYSHKIFSGRVNEFSNPEEYKNASGFSAPYESDYDSFCIGHTSTSISLGLGLARGRDAQIENYNVISIIGDGSLSGGISFEALSNTGIYNKNFIIIVNDNEMSIAENHGSIYKNLELLRKTKGEAKENYFKLLGLDYKYIEEGNNIEVLIKEFKKLKNIDHPIVVHIHTEKGHSYKYAVEQKEKWHYSPGFNIETGEFLASKGNYFGGVTRDFLIKKLNENKNMRIVTAGTPLVIGFNHELREKYNDQFIDVGIAESHALAFATGLTKAGAKTYIGLNASFMQRGFDQFAHEIAINKLPLKILVYGSGIIKNNKTHQGILDITMLSNIPNLIYYAPTTEEELLNVLELQFEDDKNPIAVRIPKGLEVHAKNYVYKNTFFEFNKYDVLGSDKEIVLIGVGDTYFEVEKAKDLINQKLKRDYVIANPKNITELDKEFLDSLNNKTKFVITVEDGIINGGYGQKVASYLSKYKIPTIVLGVDNKFVDMDQIQNIYKKYNLSADELLKIVESLIK